MIRYWKLRKVDGRILACYLREGEYVYEEVKEPNDLVGKFDLNRPYHGAWMFEPFAVSWLRSLKINTL